jgi:predicted flap endonuclease-1-like 5' DNA nuclease
MLPAGSGVSRTVAAVDIAAPRALDRRAPVHHAKEPDMAVENDLAELKGIGPKYAAMLKEIGVDSIKELRHRNPANLKEMIESRHGKVIGLSEQTVRSWVEAAKAHQ